MFRKKQKASWTTKLDHSSTKKDKKMIHLDNRLHFVTKQNKLHCDAKQLLCEELQLGTWKEVTLQGQ
jgi:hypothetical protein